MLFQTGNCSFSGAILAATLALASCQPAEQQLADRAVTSTTIQVDAAVERHSRLYGDQPPMVAGEVRDLLSRRRAAANEAAETVGRGGAAIVPHVRDRYAAATGSRDRIVLLDGLGRNDSVEAIEAIEEIIVSEAVFGVRLEGVRALKGSDVPAAIDVLRGLAISDLDPRLRVSALQGLALDPGSVTLLARLATADTERLVRIEAIAALGALGTEDARIALQEIALVEEAPAGVRLHARRELERSFGFPYQADGGEG